MELFFELIQVALGNRHILSKTPSAAEWLSLFEQAQKQAVVGLAFEALEQLSKEGQKPPLNLLYQWIGYAEQIKQQNLIVNKRCIEITKLFSDAGFRTCILKGQGNARLYPNPLLRISGDIDLWVTVHGRDKKEYLRGKIDEFVHNTFPEVKGGRMHIQFPIFSDVAVEVHYMPRYMNTPKCDRRLQSFFQNTSEEQFNHLVTLQGAEGTCAVPTTEFNMVQQLSHLMSHFMGEGIGLRQFIDYYFVLKAYPKEGHPETTYITEVLKRSGLLKFARGVMWVENRLLGLEEEYLIAEPSERIGHAIQRTIEEGGNFGHHSSVNAYRHQSTIGRFVGGAKQSLRAMRYFPIEAIWKLIGKIN